MRPLIMLAFYLWAAFGGATSADTGGLDYIDLRALIDETDTIVLAESVPFSRQATNVAARRGGASLDRANAEQRVRSSGGTEEQISLFGNLARLRAVEVLKGHRAQNLYVVADVLTAADVPPVDFDGHSRDEFWTDASLGRRTLDQPGRASALYIGGRYLVFVGSTHPKAQELILSEEDDWLQFVRDALASSSAD
ncbi:MAG: hypothetical protein AAF292_10070 [Pseudomonadota bacterium]